MQKQHTPVFRTAVGGFNKTDVNMYIARLARDFGEQSAALKEQLASFEEKAAMTDTVCAELEVQKAKNELLMAQVAELTALLTKTKDSLRAVCDELDANTGADK